MAPATWDGTGTSSRPSSALEGTAWSLWTCPSKTIPPGSWRTPRSWFTPAPSCPVVGADRQPRVERACDVEDRSVRGHPGVAPLRDNRGVRARETTESGVDGCARLAAGGIERHHELYESRNRLDASDASVDGGRRPPPGGGSGPWCAGSSGQRRLRRRGRGRCCSPPRPPGREH